MRKTNISVYLAKSGMTPEDIVVGMSSKGGARRRGRKEPPERQEIEGVGTLYYRQSWQHSPAWVADFFGNTIDADAFCTSSASAALLVPVGERILAITFGQGRHLLDAGVMEERFGLKVVLNSCEDSCFRQVSSTSVAGNAGKTSEQLPRLSKLTDFGVDSVTDTLDKVVARPEDDDIFDGTITGSDALACSTRHDVGTIVGLLGEVMERYASDAYKERYPWVDNVMPVKDPLIIGQLEEKAVRLINAHDARIWTAPPELIESWGRIAYFHIPGCGDHLDDIAIGDVLRSYASGLSSYKQLDDKRVTAVDSHDGLSTLFNWRVSQCLYGEVEHGGDDYCVNAGKWYRISRDYAQDVNKTYMQAILHDTTGFPPCKKGTHEDAYNEKLAASNDAFLLMDKKNISYGLAHSSVELCDVLAGNDIFIHVKHYSGSATLSHLFSQGYNSAFLVNSDPVFVEKAIHIGFDTICPLNPLLHCVDLMTSQRPLQQGIC